MERKYGDSQLQDLCRCALDRRVHAAALGKAALAPVIPVIDIREITPAAKGCLAVAVESSCSDRLFLPLRQARVACLQIDDDLSTLFLTLVESRLELQRALKTAGKQTVEGAEVYVLGDRPAFLVRTPLFLFEKRLSEARPRIEDVSTADFPSICPKKYPKTTKTR